MMATGLSNTTLLFLLAKFFLLIFKIKTLTNDQLILNFPSHYFSKKIKWRESYVFSKNSEK